MLSKPFVNLMQVCPIVSLVLAAAAAIAAAAVIVVAAP
jgi:hypothetical protein